MTLRLAWYGDDFTGATDTLRVAAKAGLRSVLFLDVPTASQLESAGELDVLGIAGAARTMNPSQMGLELARIGLFFKDQKVPIVHYKCCSTFDSSPQMGSLAAAVAVLDAYVDNPATVVVGGQPDIGRYCCFGNLFASAGNGGEVYRLDRHPTMRTHPVTPMEEADLRQHLALQGLGSVSGIAYPEYGRTKEAFDDLVDAQASKGAVLFDVADSAHLPAVGRQLDRQSKSGSLLVLGSSVVVQALSAWWREAGVSKEIPVMQTIAPEAHQPCNGPVFVFAGSMSPVTAKQVACADSYERIPLSSAGLLHDAEYAVVQLTRICALLDQQKHVLAYVENMDNQRSRVDPGQLALVTAGLVNNVVGKQAGNGRPLRRLGVAGGDTSSRAAQALDIWALSFIEELAPGVALCKVHSDEHHLDGMQLMLKGGQMGAEDIFEQLLNA